MLMLIACILVCGATGMVFACIRRSAVRPGMASCSRGAFYGAAFGAAFYFVSGVGGSAAMNQSTSNVKHITQGAFDADVIRSAKPVVVDFYATWCGPCKILSPRLDKLAESFTNRINFIKINVDESPDIAGQFNIHEIPTLLLFKDGKVVDRLMVEGPELDSLKARLATFANTGS